MSAWLRPRRGELSAIPEPVPKSRNRFQNPGAGSPVLEPVPKYPEPVPRTDSAISSHDPMSFPAPSIHYWNESQSVVF